MDSVVPGDVSDDGAPSPVDTSVPMASRTFVAVVGLETLVVDSAEEGGVDRDVIAEFTVRVGTLFTDDEGAPIAVTERPLNPDNALGTAVGKATGGSCVGKLVGTFSVGNIVGCSVSSTTGSTSGGVLMVRLLSPVVTKGA